MAKNAKKKTSARRVIKSSWPRHTALSDTLKISVPKDNPFRPESTRWYAYEALKKSKTVGQALDDRYAAGKHGTTRGLRRYVLRNLVHDKAAKVG